MKIYIDPQGNTYEISYVQGHLVKDDWIECQKKEDGTYADNYNLDGTPAPDTEPTVDQVKAEAHRRIVAICPEWEQRNFIATDLTYTKIILAGGTLTSEQETKRSEMETIWESIQDIRSKSDDLKNMSPIPYDFTDDSYWI